MAGWKSRYDYPQMSNTEKYTGRILHVQDNFWEAAKILAIPAIIYVIYVIKSENLLDFSYIRDFLNYLR